MRFRARLSDPPPPTAEVYGRLKFQREDAGPRPAVKAWRGRAERPYANYWFKSLADREAWIDHEKRAEDSHAEYEAKRRAERASRLEEMLAQLQVGSLLHYSWGYDQTQCEFYQVVGRKGRRVTIREIAAQTVPGTEGFMCDHRRPVPGRFVGEPMSKLITPYGISMKFGTATPCNAVSTFYCSWYA